MSGLLTGFSYLLGMTGLLLFAVILAGRSVPRSVLLGIAILSMVVTFVRCDRLFQDGTAAGDHYAFYVSGRDALAGRNPYLERSSQAEKASIKVANDNVALNPPSALPLFMLLTLGPLHQSYLGFVVLNLLLTLILPVLAARALASPESAMGQTMRKNVPLFAAVLLVSWGVFLGVVVGQLYFVVAAGIIAALWAQRADRPYLAGILLAFATIKPNTLMPFLLLFLRRSDWKTWLMLSATTLGLILIGTPPLEVIGRLRFLLERISTYGQPGRINDASFMNPISSTILGIDRLLFCLGFTHRRAVSLTQIIILVGVGLMLARRILFNGNAERAASISLIAIYSTVFLYHRQGDAVILILPLTYALASFSEKRDPAPRGLLVFSMLCLLVPLFIPGTVLTKLQTRVASPGMTAAAIRVLVLPLSNYAIVAGFVSLWMAIGLGERREIPRAKA